MDCNHQCYGLALERVRTPTMLSLCRQLWTTPHATLGMVYVLLLLLQECLHCIHPDCVQDDKQTKVRCGLGGSPPVWCGSGALIHPIPFPRNSQDDYCNICWVEGLGAKPCISLTGCGHLFHYDCAKKKLARPPSPSYTASIHVLTHLHNRPRAGPQP